MPPVPVMDRVALVPVVQAETIATPADAMPLEPLVPTKVIVPVVTIPLVDCIGRPGLTPEPAVVVPVMTTAPPDVLVTIPPFRWTP